MTTQITDSELVQTMLGGDKEAFAELYRRQQRSRSSRDVLQDRSDPGHAESGSELARALSRSRRAVRSARVDLQRGGAGARLRDWHSSVEIAPRPDHANRKVTHPRWRTRKGT